MKPLHRLSPFIIIVLSVVLLCSSCAQFGSFQTGRTMEDELVEIGAAAEGITIDPTENSGSLGFAVVPNLVLWGRAALSDNLEMGLALSSGLNAKIDARYQLLGTKTSEMAGAVGLGYEYQWSGEDNSTMVHRAHLPLYYSYHLNRHHAFYVTPRYTYQYVSDSADTHFIGSALGYQHVFSSGITWSTEFSYYAPLTEGQIDSNIFMLGSGIKYRFFR